MSEDVKVIKDIEPGNHAAIVHVPEGVMTSYVAEDGGSVYRLNGKASIVYRDNEDNLLTEIWTNTEGVVSRLDGPAMVDYEANTKKWCVDGAFFKNEEEFNAHPGVIEYNKNNKK